MTEVVIDCQEILRDNLKSYKPESLLIIRKPNTSRLHAFIANDRFATDLRFC